ncbi:MAG: AAA family ATPase [Polyangiaceae bacterium]
MTTSEPPPSSVSGPASRGSPRAELPQDLAAHVVATHPLPIADAVVALLAAESVFEARDRVVEVFRAEVRLLAALVLAARLQLGPGPGGDSAQMPALLRGIRSRGLTDGQWVALIRDGLRPWASAHESHPLAELVRLMHARKAELPKLFDELLVMRKSETVAHGASGTRAAIEEILARRVPQLARTLELLGPLWDRLRVVVPSARPEGGGEVDRLPAAVAMGASPHRGRFRRLTLATATDLPAGEALVVDRDGRPVLALNPVVLFRRASPDAIEELFMLDGGVKSGAVYVAFPSMSEHREATVWSSIEGALSDDEPAPAAEVATTGKPYRGLASFGADDAALFFGREEQTEALANRIRRHGMLTVTGPSGSGKTSLLRAGVLPLLGDTQRTFLRPGIDPEGAFAAKISETTGLDRTSLRDLLVSDQPRLVELIEQRAREAEKLHVVVVDQGEELLTLTADVASRDRFARALVALATHDGPVRVVFSVREDFFGRLATVPAFRDVYSQRVEVVTTPDELGLIRTLVAPAQAFGYSFEDEELVRAMTSAVATAPAALALLQFCADKLWERRDRKWRRLTWDAYRALGGVEGALAHHADAVLAAMTGPETAACRSLFLRLVSGERTRTVTPLAEILDAAKDRDLASRVLDTLIAARLVTVNEDEGGATVELVHEALIKHWGELDRWLGEDEEGQKLAHALRQAARERNGRGRPRDLAWRGELLSELVRYRRRAREPLTGLEHEFAEASEREERRGRRVRRALGAAALVATSAFSVFALWQWRRTEASRKEAEAQREETAKAKVDTEIRGLVAEARGHEPAGRTNHALALLRGATALETERGETSATALSLELERLGRSTAPSVVLSGHTSGVFRVCGLAGRDRVVTTSFDETIKIWEASTARLIATVPPQGDVMTQLACSPDGTEIATTWTEAKKRNGWVDLWDAETGAHRLRLPEFSQPVQTVTYVRGGAELAVLSRDGILRFFDAKGGALTATIGDDKSGFHDSDVGRTRVATTDGEAVQLWDLSTHALLRTFPSTDHIATLALSADGTRVAFAALDRGTVELIDADTGALVKSMKPAGSLGVAHIGFVPSASGEATSLVASGPRGTTIWRASDGDRLGIIDTDAQHAEFRISPDGTLLATIRGTSVDLWDLASGVRLAELSGHDSEIQDFAFTPDSAHLLTASYDRTARVFATHQNRVEHYWCTDGALHMPHSFSRDARRVALGEGDGAVAVYETDTAAEALSSPPLVRIPGARPEEALLDPEGSHLLVRRTPKRIELFELAHPDAPLVITSEVEVTAAAWSTSGSAFALGLGDGSLQIRDARGSITHTSLGPSSRLSTLAWAPQDDLLVAGYLDRSIRVVRPDGTVVFEPEKTIGIASRFVFSSDGASLAIADQERVRWIDTTSWEISEARDHEQAIIALAFSPDGKTLASGSADQTIALRRRGAPVKKLNGHTSAVMSLTFSADGARLLSTSQDKQALVWDMGVVERTPVGGRAGAGVIESFSPFDAGIEDGCFKGEDHIVLVGNGGNGPGIALLRSAPADRTSVLEWTRGLTNLRACRESFAVVPLTGPIAEPVFASEPACAER